MTESLDGPAHKSSGDPAALERTPEELPPNSTKLSIMSPALAIVALAVFWSVMVTGFFGVRAVDGVVFIVAAVAGVILGVGAVVTGVVARRRARRGDAGRGGVALAGIALGVVAVVLPAIILAGMAYKLYSDYKEFEQCIRGSGYPKYLCLKECPEFLDSLCRREIGW